MGIFKRRRISEQYIREGPRQQAMIPRYTAPPARNTQEWMAAFGKNPRLAPVEKIASDLSYAEGALYRLDSGGNKIEIQEHPFLDFICRPNPLVELTASAIWKLHMEYLLLKGEAYCIIERYANGMPAELWPVPPQWVQTIPYQGFPFYTIRSTDGTIINVSVDDMFAQRDLNPADPYSRGLGQAESVADEVEIDEYAAKFQKNFFYNGATPDTVVILPGADENQVKRFRETWLDKFAGVFRSHGVEVLKAPKDGHLPTVNKLSDNMKDLDMINGRTFTRDAIMEHFGVPREIMGITQNSNRATADAAQYIYAKNVLWPRLMQRQDAINLQLLPSYGDNLYWEYDDVIPHDVEFDKSIAMEGWQNGMLTKNESKELLGMETDDKGNIYKIGFADLFVRADEDLTSISGQMANMQYTDISEPLETDRNTVEIEDTVEDLGEHDIEILQKAAAIRMRMTKASGRDIERVRAMQTRKYELAMGKYLRQQEQQIQRALTGHKDDNDIWDMIGITQEEYSRLTDEEKARIISEFADGLMDWKDETSLLERILAPLWEETYKEGAELLQKTYRLNGMDLPELTHTARVRGGQRVTRVTQTTKEAIGRIITAGLEEGKGRNQLTDEIIQEMGTSGKRARLIAAQECNISLQAGNYDMAKRGGFREKTWHVTDVSKARDTHLDLNGRTVPFDAPFVTKRGNRLMMPCDPDCSVAEETVNCHCFLTYA